MDGALEENGTITSDGFTLLPPGEYDFRVAGVSWTRPSSDKFGHCKMAQVSIEIEHDGAVAKLVENLILHKDLEWKLGQFFHGIGLKRYGEPLIMRWDLNGMWGRAKIKVDTYQGRDGKDRESNKIERFLPHPGGDAPMWVLERNREQIRADAAGFEPAPEEDIPF